jgi:hypothetical protein
LFRIDVGNLVNDAKGKKPMYVEKTKKDVFTHPNSQQCWVPPDLGGVKVNVDASFSENNMNGSWGAVARNHRGEVIFSAWDVIKQAPSAECCEAEACVQGLKLGILHCLGNITIETDCLSFIKSFDPGGEFRSRTSLLGKEFMSLKPKGRYVALVHVKIIAN